MTLSRIGLGPVFVYEWITSARRWQSFAIRSLFVLLLLVTLVVVWQNSRVPMYYPLRAMAAIGRSFFLGVTGTQLVLVLLAAPAATAGSICLDRSRGTLNHMLMTDLSAAEIVLGKLAARLVPVLGLLACTLPMMEILALLGGLDPTALLGGFVVALGVAVLGCSLALALSLWVGKTHEALMGTYAVWCVWLLSRWMITLLARTIGWPWASPPRTADPFLLALAPYWWPNTVRWTDYVWFLGVTWSISAILILVAMLRLRSVCTRERVRKSLRWPAARPGVSIWRLLLKNVPWLSPSLDRNPVLWREWQRGKPSRWAAVIAWLYAGASTLFSMLAILWPGGFAGIFVNAFQVSIGLLLLSVTAATSLAEERARGSLDLLLSTPLSAREIVLGKWLGTYRFAPLLAILPALVIGFGAYVSDKGTWWAPLMIVYVLCTGAAITSLGLAMATRTSRLGRAVGMTVSVYVLVTVGMVGLNIQFGSTAVGMASPFLWAGIMTLEAANNSAPQDLGWGLFWTVMAAVIAAGLLATTLASFERRLGRNEDAVTLINRPSRTFQYASVIYLTLMVALSLATIDPWLGPSIIALQFTLGSFLVAGRAASSLSDHRAGGVVGPLAFPGFSARRIVLLKWAAALRLVAGVVVFPALIVVWRIGPEIALARGPLTLIAYALSAGAAAASLGILMAIWCRRSGWAVSFTLCLWGLVNVGGPLAIALGGNTRMGGLAMSSPFVVVAAFVVPMSEVSLGVARSVDSALVWGVVNAFAAIALLLAALATCDRGVGTVEAYRSHEGQP